MDELAAIERQALAEALECLAEVDRRKAYEEPGYPDMFAYCMRRLKYSNGSAYRHIYSARAADRYPEIYEAIRSGALTLCVVSLVWREMQDADPAVLRAALDAVRGKSKRQAEEWMAARKPSRPPMPDHVKATPPAAEVESVQLCSHGGMPRADDPSMFAAPLKAPPLPTYEYKFTASARLHSAIERLRDMLWNKLPFGTLDDFLAEAVIDFLERHDPEPALKNLSIPSGGGMPRRDGARTEAAARSRTIPRKVRNAVWARDGGRCVYSSDVGVRCEARRGLQIDHVLPFSLGGSSRDMGNLRLLCRAHNQLERRRTLGEGNPEGVIPAFHR